MHNNKYCKNSNFSKWRNSRINTASITSLPAQIVMTKWRQSRN